MTAAAAPDLVRLDGRRLSELIHARRASCVEVMTAYLDQIERLNPQVNAIVSLQPRDALLREAAERDAALGRGEPAGIEPDEVRGGHGRARVRDGCWAAPRVTTPDSTATMRRPGAVPPPAMHALATAGARQLFAALAARRPGTSP